MGKRNKYSRRLAFLVFVTAAQDALITLITASTFNTITWTFIFSVIIWVFFNSPAKCANLRFNAVDWVSMLIGVVG